MKDLWLIIENGEVVKILLSASRIDEIVKKEFENRITDVIEVEHWKVEDEEEATFYSSECHYCPL